MKNAKLSGFSEQIDGIGTGPENRGFLIKLLLKIDGIGTGPENRGFFN